MLAQVTTGFTTAGTLLLLGAGCKGYYIQNNGTGAWRLSFDGGAACPPGTGPGGSGRGGTDPTTTTGFLLAGGDRVSNALFQFTSGGMKPIRAIFSGDGGTQVLDIVTDDPDSTCPAHA